MEITGWHVGQVVMVTQDGEHFGKQGIVKEVSEEDCQVRVPTGEEDCFTQLYFDKGDLK